MTWCSTELRAAVHVHPYYEDGHILGPWCWCTPRTDQEPDWQRPMVVHRDELERSGPVDPNAGG